VVTWWLVKTGVPAPTDVIAITPGRPFGDHGPTVCGVMADAPGALLGEWLKRDADD